MADPIIKTCFSVLVLIVGVCLFAQWIAPHDPNSQKLLARLRPPVPFEGSLTNYPLGTDELGRDLLSRCLHGMRVTIGIAILGSIISMVIGLIIGTVSGFVGGIVDDLLMGLVDVQIAFPFTLIALLAVALLGTDMLVFICVIGIAGWENYARVVRGQILALNEEPFIAASKVAGAGFSRIVFVHMLPNISSPIIVLWTLTFSNIVLLESSLSFLGLGVQPPTATLGSITGFGRNYLASDPHLAAIPAVLIMLIALVMLLLGDWLRDTLDVKLRKEVK
jgi:peptide/nickel transport system permease protein